MIITPPAMRETVDEYRRAQDADPCISLDTTLANYCTASLKEKGDDVEVAADATDVLVFILALNLLAVVASLLAVDWYTQKPVTM